MKTVKYQKWCFDQIEGVVAENKALTAEVDRLRLEAEKEAVEKAAQEERLLDLNWCLADKDREKRGKSSEQLELTAWSVLMTNNCCFRSGGGDRTSPKREGPARLGACQCAGDRAQDWRGAEEQESGAGW